jgi:DHA1 family tetracycline resistance protein-like MFS transporter
MSAETASDAEPSPNRSRGTLPTIFAVIVIDLIGFGVVLPILPYYAREYDAAPAVLGLLVATHAAMQFVFSPVWGRVSDRIGRRPVMLFTILGTAVSLYVLGAVGSLAGLFVARALSGFFGANISVAVAYVTDVTEESERTRWMGMVGASFGIGFILGPAIGGLLAPVSHGAPMFFAAGLGALNWIFAIFMLREPTRSQDRASEPHGLRESLRDPTIRQLCLINLLFTIGVTQLETIFAYLMMDRFGYDAQQVAYILVVMAVLMAGIQGGAMRSLATYFGEKTLLCSGLLLMALSFPLIPYPATLGLLLVPLAITAIGRAIAQPPMPSLVSMRADANNRGGVMGAFQSAASLARVIGPLLAGLLYGLTPESPFHLAGFLFVLSAALGWKLNVQVRAGES